MCANVMRLQLVTLSNLPSSASIDMPPVHIYAVFLQHDPAATPNVESTTQTNDLAGLTVREGNYLKATADVGAFEHILTTDLLNHLVFVQKVFMKVLFSLLWCTQISCDSTKVTIATVICFVNRQQHYVLFLDVKENVPRVGSRIVRIDLLRFLAGCGTRRLNQV